jgi:hypothetical protein
LELVIASRDHSGYSYGMPDDTRSTAAAYGPDRPTEDGRRNPTDATVIVTGDLDVNDDQLVEVEIQTGRGDWAGMDGQRIQVRRIQLAHIRRPGYDRRAVISARLAMSSLASRMEHPLRSVDPVTYWDLRTSMDDQRAAFCLALGIPVDNISRDGYDLSRPAARAAYEARS